MKRQTVIFSSVVLLAVASPGSVFTNFYSTFTSTTPEVGSLTLDRSNVIGGYLSLGENANNDANAQASLGLLAIIEGPGEIQGNVMVTLDWTQMMNEVTTLTAENILGQTLFTLAVDEFWNLRWNNLSVAAPSMEGITASIEIGLYANDTVNLLVNGLSYGTNLDLYYGRQNIANIFISRDKSKYESARFDDLLVTTEIIPEPAAIWLILFGFGGILGVRRLFIR